MGKGKRIVGYTRSGRAIYVIAGADDDPKPNDPKPEDPKPNDPKPEDPKPGDKTYSQEEFDRAAANIRRRAEKDAEKAVATKLAEELGVSVEDAKRIITEHKAEEDKKKSEADKAREEAERKTRDADERDRKAAAKEHQLNVERALFLAGVKVSADDDTETKSRKLAKVAALVDVEIGAEDKDITEAVEALKKDMPELFGESTPSGGAPGSDPKGRPPAPKPGEDGLERGKKRFEQHEEKVGAGYGFLNSKN